MSLRVPYLLLFVLLSSGHATAQKLDENTAGYAQAYENTRWSMLQPDGGFEDGCGSGYMAFKLNANGYFIFNNKVSGSWTMDKPNQLRMHTRDDARFILTVDETGSRLNPAGKLPLARVFRTSVFQRCSE